MRPFPSTHSVLLLSTSTHIFSLGSLLVTVQREQRNSNSIFHRLSDILNRIRRSLSGTVVIHMGPIHYVRLGSSRVILHLHFYPRLLHGVLRYFFDQGFLFRWGGLIKTSLFVVGVLVGRAGRPFNFFLRRLRAPIPATFKSRVVLGSLRGTISYHRQHARFVNGVRRGLTPRVLLTFSFLVKNFREPYRLIRVLQRLVGLVFIVVLR